jgi:hypothetical protein
MFNPSCGTRFCSIALAATAGFLITALPVYGVDRRPALCVAGEVPVFSCKVGGKIVSLCASPDLNEAAGTMTYRFGRKGGLELVHPTTPTHPSGAFSAGIDSAERGDFVRFSRNEFTYTIYALVGLRDRNEEDGLLIVRGKKILRHLKCDDFAMGDKAWHLMYRAKLPADPTPSIFPQ